MSWINTNKKLRKLKAELKKNEFDELEEKIPDEFFSDYLSESYGGLRNNLSLSFSFISSSVA